MLSSRVTEQTMVYKHCTEN